MLNESEEALNIIKDMMEELRSLLISPKSPSSSRECSAIVEDDSISMDQTI